ncbi:hypothetical protein FPZ24_03780 [Sphingomonas panacisoli]|uniref:Uncharacterized protein n=1 Tax=Sphingomonas panacisoli TaxID=1813879 RepID=A0A5B8LFI3_9SPHN|nr:hypothetical protein [Sphingomonas panacisoli]QDZ06706.1 hypothetical protein FPZ24_03780 [Sphingomonas panacisoli]
MDKTIRLNLIWTIGVLLLVIAGLLVKRPGGESIVSYISFAAAITSIVLAVVAIIQSYFSGHTLSTATGSLQNIADQISKNSVDLDSKIAAFSENASALLEDLSQVPNSLTDMKSDLSDRLDKLLSSKSQDAPVEQNAAEADLPFFKGATVGMNAAVYLMARTWEGPKTVDVNKVFKSKILASYVGAVLGVIARESINGVVMETKASRFTIESFGNRNVQKIRERAANPKESTKKIFDEIDKYFDDPDIDIE